VRSTNNRFWNTREDYAPGTHPAVAIIPSAGDDVEVAVVEPEARKILAVLTIRTSSSWWLRASW
jgi:hypothetical protein